MTVAIPSRPLLAPWYRLVGDGDRLLLEHAQVVVVLEGAAVSTLLPKLLPRLDGTRTVDDLVDRLGRAARPAVEGALQTLAEHGLLVEGPPASGPARRSAHALAAAYGQAPSTVAGRLEAATIGVVGSGADGFDVARLLKLAGVGTVERSSWSRATDAHLAVVVPDAHELDRVRRWNEVALRRGLRWLPVRPFDGRMAAIGPLVLPGESACFECLLLRRAANLDFGADLVDVEAAPSAATADAAVEAWVAAVAAHVVLRFVGGVDTAVAGVMFAVEARPVPTITDHPVLRVPRCPACSGVGRRAARLPWHAAEAA